jgi:hypothetical protein
MRTETITIYKFVELPESAKPRARHFGREAISDFDSSDDFGSVKAFCDHFAVTLKDWSVGAYEPVNFSTDASNHHFRGLKLKDFERDFMPTGYCLDCDLWMTFYDEFKRTGNAKAAFNDALHAGFKAWRNDLEGQLEDDYIDDFLEANDYEFDENGKLI